MEQKFDKQSKEWVMFTDFWKLCQKVWIPDDSDSYWEEVIDLADEFIKKHPSRFARRLANALLDDLEERKDE